MPPLDTTDASSPTHNPQQRAAHYSASGRRQVLPRPVGQISTVGRVGTVMANGPNNSLVSRVKCCQGRLSLPVAILGAHARLQIDGILSLPRPLLTLGLFRRLSFWAEAGRSERSAVRPAGKLVLTGLERGWG